MKNYESYRAEDLLVDPCFLAWVKHNQPEARQFWEHWQQQHPKQRATILLAKDMAEALNNRPGRVSDELVRMEVAQIVRLTHRLRESQRNSFMPTLKRRFWSIAAVVMLVLVSSWLSWRLGSGPLNSLHLPAASHRMSAAATKWINQVNGTSQPVSIVLPDGSRMTLSAHSQASYPPSFNQTKREVHLKGEAVFSVVHDSSRPFMVLSGPLITRVLGTRFRVCALPGDSRITVSVQSGRVSVYSRIDLTSSRQRHIPDVPGVVLTANQQVVYRAEQSAYQKELVVQPTLISPVHSPDQFIFQDTPVAQVFDRLERGYGITIAYDGALFHQCTVTASLAGVPLHDQLKLICASISATYEVVDTQIVVSGKGCH